MCISICALLCVGVGLCIHVGWRQLSFRPRAQKKNVRRVKHFFFLLLGASVAHFVGDLQLFVFCLQIVVVVCCRRCCCCLFTLCRIARKCGALENYFYFCIRNTVRTLSRPLPLLPVPPALVFTTSFGFGSHTYRISAPAQAPARQTKFSFATSKSSSFFSNVLATFSRVYMYVIRN